METQHFRCKTCNSLSLPCRRTYRNILWPAFDNVVYQPIGIYNPGNHCYLNSVLQLILRILPSDYTDITFNNNIYGRLTQSILKAASSKDENELCQFKIVLSQFNSFFDGILQRDAFECLNRLIEILHYGTKQTLIDVVDPNFEDDSFVISLTKNLFNLILKKTYKCRLCGSVTITDRTTQCVNIYPESRSTISELLDKAFYSLVTKICGGCSSDTEHSEISVIETPPSVLVILFNRFHYGHNVRKDKTDILLERKFNHNLVNFDLIGTIHHHGDSASSGHYTSKIYCTDVVYDCNDHKITTLKPYDEVSNSVYIAFYEPTGL